MSTVYESLRSTLLEAKKKKPKWKHKPAPKETLDAFMNDWRGISHASMFPELGRMIGVKSDEGEARWMTVDLKPFDGMIHLKWMQVLPGDERKGVSHDVLALITDLADKHKVQMSLIAKPTGKPKIPKGKLKALYRKHGFVSIGTEEMRRDPR